MRILALAAALTVAVACGSTSSLESTSVLMDLAAQGVKAGQEANELIQKDQPGLALAVLTKHARDVDKAIDQVKQNSSISDHEKGRLLLELEGYRRGVREDREKLRMMVDLQAEFGR